MRKQYLQLLLITLGFFILQLPSVYAADSVQVVVSIPPQVYFVNQIGGDLVNAISMLPEGGFPHTYEPTPKQMKLLSEADMYVRIKVEFENAWWDKMLAANPDMHVVDSTVGISFGDDHEHEDEHPEDKPHEHEGEHHEDEETMHVHHGHDPHIWLSPKLVKLQAESICERLNQVDPNNKEIYISNKNAFLKALDELDSDIQERLTNLKTRKFMVFHPSWTYFARDYNLEQIPIEIEGKEPSVAEMAELIKTAKTQNIHVIFIQPQTSKRSAETIAKQIGAKVKTLDPLAGNWMENIRTVAGTLVEELSSD